MSRTATVFRIGGCFVSGRRMSLRVFVCCVHESHEQRRTRCIRT